jgi:hypothetical protein
LECGGFSAAFGEHIPALPAAAQLAAEDLDTLEDVFATVRLLIGLLNLDWRATTNTKLRTRRREREAARLPAPPGLPQPHFPLSFSQRYAKVLYDVTKSSLLQNQNRTKTERDYE